MRAFARKIIRVSFILIVPLHTALGQEPPKSLTFDFPGAIQSVSSSSGKVVATFRDSGLNGSGGHDYRFMVTDKHGHERARISFDHSVDGQWSNIGDILYVNDHRGPGQSDCYVLKSDAGKMSLLSLTDILVNKPESGIQELHETIVPKENIKPPETPANSEYYMSCKRWASPHAIAVVLDGKTYAGGDFKYIMTFDIETMRFALMH